MFILVSGMDGAFGDFDDIDDNLLRSLPLDFPFEDEDLTDNHTDKDTDSGIGCVETREYNIQESETEKTF